MRRIHALTLDLSYDELFDVDSGVCVDFLLFDGDVIEEHLSLVTSVGRRGVGDLHLEPQHQAQLTHVTTEDRLDRLRSHLRIQQLTGLTENKRAGEKMKW